MGSGHFCGISCSPDISVISYIVGGQQIGRFGVKAYRNRGNVMQADGKPCIVDQTGSPLKLEPIYSESLAEAELKGLLHKSPEILPVSEFDPSFAPLVSLGTEIRNIDNLFVSPNGKITIVETKLWRNPEARQEVVAQLLDYASMLNAMSYEDLEDQVKRKEPHKSLFELVNDAFLGEIDPSTFFDGVTETLESGRFLLLAVGDKIRQNLKDIADYLQKDPQMPFKFGLVELRLFNIESFPGKLIVPQVVARSKEIGRTIIKIKGLEP